MKHASNKFCLFFLLGYAQPPGYSGYPAAGAGGYGAQPQQGQPQHQIVYVNGKPKKKKILGMQQNTAAGECSSDLTQSWWHVGFG